MKKHIWLALICLLPIISKAQFVLKVSGTNLPDSVAFLRTTLFDDKNYIPKDTIFFSKGTKTIKNTKSIVGGIYFLYFPKSKQKIQFILEDKDTVQIQINGADYVTNSKINKTKNNVLLNYQQLEKRLSNYDSSYAAELKLGRKFSQTQKAAYFKIKTDSLIAFRKAKLKLFKPSDAIYIYFNTLNKLDENIPNKRDYQARGTFLKKFDLNEPKLFFTPVMRQIIVEYLSFYPLQGDTLTKGLDEVFKNMLCTNKAYSFVFDYFTKVFKNREVLNNTGGYSYLIDKYVKNNSCAFLEKNMKQGFLNELTQLQAQQINTQVMNVILEDTMGVKKNLHAFAKNYNYTVLMSWKNTVNLGQDINTAGNELFPTFYEGNLFISSNGHPGLGGLDIYRLIKGTNGEPVLKNMGYPINSAKDDFAFSIQGTKGFFSSNRNGSDDILAFDYTQSFVKIKGKIYVDSTCQPGKMVYLYQKNEQGRSILKDSSNIDNNCSYEFKIRPNQAYDLVAFDDAGNRFQQSSTSEGYQKENNDYVKDVVLINIPLSEKVKQAKMAAADALRNAELAVQTTKFIRTIDSLKTLTKDYVELHHPFDQVYIIEKDLPDYYKVIELVKRIKNKKIVIVSAADCIGSLEYNEDLSTRRANRIYRTLSKLSTNDVVIKNVGERELLKDCTDARKDIEAQVVNRYSYVFIIDKK